MANKSNELIGGAKKNKELIGLAVAAGTGAILEYIYVKAKGKKGTNANANANQNKQNPKSGKATIQNKKKKPTRTIKALLLRGSLEGKRI